MSPRPSVEPTRKFRLQMAIGLAVFSTLLLAFWAMFNWFLRDGLGPDSVESFGWEAFHRFWPEFWPGAAFCGLFFVGAYFIASRRQRPL